MSYLILDVETTGFDPYNNDILQIAYLEVDDNLQVLDAGNHYLYYEGQPECPKDAQDVHGLNNAFLRQFKSSYMSSLLTVIKKFGATVLTGYNVGFDFRFIVNYYSRMLGINNILPNSQVDLMSVFTKKNGKARLIEQAANEGITTAEVNEVFQKHFGNDPNAKTRAHDATYDVCVTYQLLKRAKEQNLI